MTDTVQPIRKYAASLEAGQTTLEVRVPAQLISGEVSVTIDGEPAVTEGPDGSHADAFTIVGSTVVLNAPLATGGCVEVTFGDHD